MHFELQSIEVLPNVICSSRSVFNFTWTYTTGRDCTSYYMYVHMFKIPTNKGANSHTIKIAKLENALEVV